jgi:virginiamycin A acetyltransferase
MVKNNNISSDAKIIDSTIGDNVKVYRNAEIKKCKLEDQIIIGDDAIIIDSQIYRNTSINRRNYILRSKIGRYTYTGIGSSIRSAEVGNFCSLGWNVSIGGGNHDYSHVTSSPLWRFNMLDGGNIKHSTNHELQNRYENFGYCSIGNDVWFASNVIVLRDVKIGNGAVIGAGAIVTKNVEPYSIVVGVPAKVVKKRFDDKTIAALQEIQWWNWSIETIRNNVDLIFLSTVDGDVIQKLMEISKKI